MLMPYRIKAEYAANNICTIPQTKIIKNLVKKVIIFSYFFSNASTALVISSLVFGYKYPAIICPTPIAATKAPTPFKIEPRKKTPKRNKPIPVKNVITPDLL